MGFWQVLKRIGTTAGKVGLEVGIPALETYVPLSKPILDRLKQALQHSGEHFDAQSFIKAALPIAMSEVQAVPNFTPAQITVIHAIVDAAFAAGKASLRD
jgi:hypothetical protein